MQETLPIIGHLVDNVLAEPLQNANNAWQQSNEVMMQLYFQCMDEKT